MSSRTLPGNLWASQLANLPPKDVLSRLSTHLQKSTQFNEILADYFKARSAAEADYAAALNKLMRKFGDAAINDRSDTGEISIWERVMTEVQETASSHSSMSDTLNKEFEGPLRSMPNRLSSWSRIPQIQEKSKSTIKSYDSALEKTQKAQKKGGSKLQSAQNDLQNHTSTLNGMIPSLVSAQQSMTLERLTELKELGVRFETLTAENGNKQVSGSERGLNRMLGWDVEDEVRGMGVKFGGTPSASGLNGPNGPTQEMGGLGPQYSTPSRAPTLRRPTMGSDYSQSMNRPSSSSRQSDHNLPKQENSSLSSTLKSKFSRKSSLLGGIGIGGSGGTMTPAGRGRSDSSATVRTNATGAGNQGRNGFGHGTGGFETIENPNGRSDSRNGMALASPVLDSPRVDADGFTLPPDNRNQAPWERPTNAGVPRNLLDDEDDDGVSPLPTSTNSIYGAPKLNLALASQPIQESEADQQAALQKMQNTLLSKPPSGPSRKNTIRGRRDVRNTTFNTLPDDMPLAQALKLQGQQEDAAERAAMTESPTQEILATPPSSAGLNPFYVSNPRSSVSTPLVPQFTGRDNFTAASSPTTSVMGGMNPFDQAASALNGPGLRATITETVNVASKGGLVSKAMITGEICVTLRDLSKYSPLHGLGPVHIRLDEFEQLEKVAPNPKYLSQVPDRPGEYYLHPEKLASATSQQTTRPVLFKYQLHVGEGKAGDFAPIEVHPQWKVTPGETRLVINYKSNDQGRLARRINSHISSSLFGQELQGKMTDLSIIAGLGGVEVTGVQAKPAGGTWSAEKRKMVWNVNEVDFDPSSTSSAGKIVARFLSSTDGGLAQPEGVTLRWKVDGSLTSALGLSVVNGTEGGWKFEEVGKAVISGKYVAE